MVRLIVGLTKKRPPISLLLLLALTLYYLLFLNLGFVPTDEGYSLTTAWMINSGRLPYRDFFLQYPPLFYYTLAFFFKLFGATMLVGRYFALLFHLGVFVASLAFLRLAKLSNPRFLLLTLLLFAGYGYPLSNIPVTITPEVLLTVMLMLVFYRVHVSGLSARYSLLIGLLLGTQIAIKQNIGLAYVLAASLLILLFPAPWRDRIESVFTINVVWLALNGLWILYFFILSSSHVSLSYFLSFGSRLFSVYIWSYPSLSLLLQPSGLFKLLPYYLPPIFAVILLGNYIKSRQFLFLILLLPFVGYVTNIIPQSDLIHVYPFLPMCLLATAIYMERYFPKTLLNRVGLILIFVTAGIGFYLTLIRGYYRYYPPYRQQNQPLVATRAAGITTCSEFADAYNGLIPYFASHPELKSVVVYPFDPGLYFLLNIMPVSYHLILWPGYLTEHEEETLISSISSLPTATLVVNGHPPFSTPISKWVSKMTPDYQSGDFLVYNLSNVQTR